MPIVLTLFLLIFLSSCGDSNSNAGIPIEKKKRLPINGSNISGIYTTYFTTLNANITGPLQGSVTVQRQEDEFTASVRLIGGPSNTWHPQNIHRASHCPDSSDDLNADGFIDYEEGHRVWGDALLPLDSNINSLAAGKNVFPIADSSGSYSYKRTASFEKMFHDLGTQGLDFEKVVVVIHGSSSALDYPDTVASEPGYEVHKMLPIACGLFIKSASIPEEPEIEEVPAPNEEPERPTPLPENEDDGDDDNDQWYDRLSRWWRHRWISN